MLSKDNLEEWAKDLPDWVFLSPALSAMYAEVQSFLARVIIMGDDAEDARQEAIYRIQVMGFSFEKASEQIIEEIWRHGTFSRTNS